MSQQDLDDKEWWELGIPKSGMWMCPACNVASPVEDWKEVEPFCEDCGSHEGRECPNCEEWFDHVWGIKRLSEVNNARQY